MLFFFLATDGPKQIRMHSRERENAIMIVALTGSNQSLGVCSVPVIIVLFW